MTPALAPVRRVALFLCLAVLALAQACEALALAPDLKGIAADRALKKEAAAQGRLPLPGTPDLSRLDERLAKRGLPEDAALFIRIFKAESELEVWMSRGPGAAYALFATYPICYWSGTLGPKIKEGDRQAPEGFYTVTLPQANPNGPRWPKALDIGFPNTFDMLHARSGSYILIHGGCASIGCFAMTNGVNKEIHALAMRALDAGQAYVPVHVFPFRMTEQNLARYETPALRSFWRNLKEGYDLFQRTHRPPRISVCGIRYDFEATGYLDGANPGPIDTCPRTAPLIKELEELKSRVAEQAGPLPTSTVAAAQTARLYLSAAQRVGLTVSEPNTRIELAPESLRASVSKILTRPLRCSLALPSCRKYATLRQRLVDAACAQAEPRVVKKVHKKKKRRHKRKKRKH